MQWVSTQALLVVVIVCVAITGYPYITRCVYCVSPELSCSGNRTDATAENGDVTPDLTSQPDSKAPIVSATS